MDVIVPYFMQAIYVEHLLKADELSRLQQGGAGLAAVDSPLASLLMGRAYSQKELDRTEDKISRMELEHHVETRWRAGQSEYKAGFEMLRERSLTR